MPRLAVTKKTSVLATMSAIVKAGVDDIPRSNSIFPDSAPFTGVQHDAKRQRDPTVQDALSIGGQIQHIAIEKSQLAIEFSDHLIFAKKNEVCSQKEKYRNACSSQ